MRRRGPVLDAIPTREELVASFLQLWTAERLFETWKEEVEALGIDLSTVIHEVRIVYPRWVGERVRGSDGMSLVEWWPKKEVTERSQEVQRWLDEPHEGYSLPAWLINHFDRKGARYTIEHLIQAGGDVEKIAAVFIAASLFSRMGSARRCYPREEWPPYEVANAMGNWAHTKMQCSWPAMCTDALPIVDEPTGLVLKRMPQFIRFLAAENARSLHMFTPIRVVFVDQPGAAPP